MRDLTEEEIKQKCMCEDPRCAHAPLKHFQKCPKCGSRAWHKIIKKGEPCVK